MKNNRLKKTFSKIPTLETERLVLRRMKPDDYADMYEYARRKDVTEYLLWEPHPDRKTTHRYLYYIQDRYKAGEFFDWAVILKEENKMIGTVGFSRIDEANSLAEVGYVINPVYHGNGYAPEALLEVMMFGFMELNLHRIEAKFMHGNDRSRRVMEKCGMRYEGCARDSMYVKGDFRSIHTYSILSDEFIHRYIKPRA